MPKYQVNLPDGPVLLTRGDGSTERHTVKDGQVNVAADKADRFLADLPGAALAETDDSAPATTDAQNG